jgi:uncharacterized protein (UPF0332 family)
MAKESLRGAKSAMEVTAFRSCVSRSYYAAFQAATAMLLHAGETPPTVEAQRRESWPHAVTPDMVKDNLKRLITHRQRRLGLASSLAKLYRWRVEADYVSKPDVLRLRAETAFREAGSIVKVARDVIEE